ncbi:MAG TPA: DNA-protecting protein DprA, partial [Solibacterales bacterium]|nr:DNA-protecting protein DprA [Bryobacterales bacterium]
MPAVRELTREEELHWLALKMVPGLGMRRAAQLIQKFKSPEAVFQATTAELEAAGMLGGLARSISSGCSFEDG